VTVGDPVLRLAAPADAGVITEVMRASVHDLFPAFYDERQTASAAVYVAHVDQTLLTAVAMEREMDPA